MKELSDKDSAVCKSKGGKDIKFDGKIPKWSDSDPGKTIYIQQDNVRGMPMVSVKRWVNLYLRIGSMRNIGTIERKKKVIK